VHINKIIAPYHVKVEKCRISYDAGVLKLSIKIQYESDLSINPLSSPQSHFLQERNQQSHFYGFRYSASDYYRSTSLNTYTSAGFIAVFVITTHCVLEQ